MKHAEHEHTVMADVLCVTSGLSGMLFSTVGLCRRLAAAGHRVTYVSVGEARDTCVQNGLRFVPLEPDRYAEFRREDARLGILRRLATVSARRARAIESTATHGFVRFVEQERPDLVLIDLEMHEHVISLSGTGVPIALINTFVSIWRQPGMPPPHHSVQPGVGWKGSRAAIALQWLWLIARKRGRAWRQKLARLGCDRLSILRAMAGAAGFDFRAETDDTQWPIPFSYRRLPVLTLHALEFEFPHTPPARVRYLGPFVSDSRHDPRTTLAVRRQLEVVFARRRAGEGRKLVYAGFGSFFSVDVALLRRVIAVVGEQPSWDLVLSTGDRLDPVQLGALPGNVMAFRWVPQLDVLRNADLCVNHGASNTLDECVVHGVPVLIYCGFETDMGGATARASYHGIGIAGNRRDGIEVIRKHMTELLGEPRFAANVQRLRAQYQSYAERRVAERAIEALVAREEARV